jgi:hypothetical protein
MSDLLNQPVNEAEFIDLSIAAVRKQLAKRILDDIDEYCVKTYDDGHRTHLGASLIGHPCSRYLFNTFRWVKHTIHSGRMQRLFRTGHKEEARFIEYLRGIGFEVEDVTAEGKQFRISAVRGHFGGSMDGQLKPPPRYRIGERIMLAEFKTQGTGAKFTKLKENGVAKEKPQHFAQMCSYGKSEGFNFAIYMAKNKNDDDLHVEVVALDMRLGEQNLRKAEDVINARIPPPKLAQSAAHFDCKYCDFVGICHEGVKAEVNCRSCARAIAVDNAQWFCETHNAIIPPEFIKDACGSWESIV